MITLEYLHEGSEDCPLVRLYNFERSDVVALRDLCRALAAGRMQEVSLENQTWVNAIGGCSFVLRASRFDLGVNIPKSGTPLVMEYSDEGWRAVAEKIAPFFRDGFGDFQWLTNEGDVNVLLSRDGLW